VNTIDDFIGLLRDEMGLPVTRADAGLHLESRCSWS